MSSSSTLDVQRVRGFDELLRKNKKASLEEVISVLESGDKAVPFNPEATFSMSAENLPVCLAVRAHRADILDLLIQKYHADVNFSFCLTLIPAVTSMNLIPASEVTTINFPSFIVLACCNDFDLCSKMLTLVTKNEFKCPGYVLLHLTQAAVTCVDIRVLEFVLKNFKLLPTDRNGRTILHHVAMQCTASTSPDSTVIATLRELVKVRASIDVFDDYDLTALQYACWAGSLAAVKVLVAAGADVNKYSGNESCTALHLAVAAQSIDVVHELLRAGAKRNTDVTCDWVENNHVLITGDPADVARAAGNFRLARYVADPLRSSLGVLLDSDAAAEGGSAAAIMFEPSPGEAFDGVCEICLEETKLIPLGRCHHAFCKNCLASWFRTSSNGVTRPQCPRAGCNLPVSVYDINVVLGKAEADRVDQLLLQRCLAEMPDFQWCPHCSYGGIFARNCMNAECTNCGYMFCTQCRLQAHPGISCGAKCLQKIDNSRTQRWMTENTKPCPKCHVPIVKNGGCSHMKCSRCSYEFCWFCLGKYQGVYTFDQRCPCPKRT